MINAEITYTVLLSRFRIPDLKVLTIRQPMVPLPRTPAMLPDLGETTSSHVPGTKTTQVLEFPIFLVAATR